MESFDRNAFQEAAARTLWLSAWADHEEERGRSVRGEIDDQAPPTPGEAREAAALLLARMELTLEPSALFGEWQEAGGPGSANYSALDRFAHCCALSATGAAVGLIDDTEAGYRPPELPSLAFHYMGGEEFWIE